MKNSTAILVGAAGLGVLGYAIYKRRAGGESLSDAIKGAVADIGAWIVELPTRIGMRIGDKYLAPLIDRTPAPQPAITAAELQGSLAGLAEDREVAAGSASAAGMSAAEYLAQVERARKFEESGLSSAAAWIAAEEEG